MAYSGLPEVDKIGFSFFNRVFDIISAGKAKSYSEFLKSGRIEPIALIDAKLQFGDTFLPNVLQSLQSLMAAYVLQAAAMTMTVGNISVKRELERLNPNRDPADNFLNTAGYVLNMENFKDRLPDYSKPSYGLEASFKMNREDIPVEVGINRNTVAQITEDSNLVTGKLLEIQIRNGADSIPVLIALRLNTYILESNLLSTGLSISDKGTTSMKERLFLLKKNVISIKDFIMCNDMIDEYHKSLFTDKTGIFNEIRNRKAKNTISTLLSGNPSIGVSSNLVVMDKSTRIDLEGKIHGKLDNIKTRKEIFDASSLMIICIIDQDLEQAVIYTRGLAEATKISLKNMKNASKGNGPDIASLMKTMLEGKPPVF